MWRASIAEFRPTLSHRWGRRGPRPYQLARVPSVLLGRRTPMFHGWVVAFGSAFGVAFGVSAYLPATIGLMVGPLHRDLGWTVPQVLLALSFATTCTIVAAPLVGSLIDRYGARHIIALSFVCEGLIIASCCNLHDLRWFYFRYAAFALLGTGTTAIGFSTLISRWFDRRRGLALGIALGGLGAGGVFWSLVTQWLFDHLGWRQAFPILGAIVIAIAPALFLALRDDPASLGLTVEGCASGGPSRVSTTPGLTLRAAAARAQYWLMILTFLIISSSTYGVILNLVPLLVSRGATATHASHVQASLWSVLVFGRIATGWLMDRYFAPRVALMFLFPSIIGLVMLATDTGSGSAFVAAMLVGLAAGAEVDVMAYLVGRYFGVRHFAAVYATFFAIYAVGTSIGPALTAAFADRCGGYAAPLWCLVAGLCLAAVLLLRFPRFGTFYD
jgi:MFS family permease